MAECISAAVSPGPLALRCMGNCVRADAPTRTCRPEELMMKDAGVLKCPMCHVPSAVKQNVRWDMHGNSHGIACVTVP